VLLKELLVKTAVSLWHIKVPAANNQPKIVYKHVLMCTHLSVEVTGKHIVSEHYALYSTFIRVFKIIINFKS